MSLMKCLVKCFISINEMSVIVVYYSFILYDMLICRDVDFVTSEPEGKKVLKDLNNFDS